MSKLYATRWNLAANCGYRVFAFLLFWSSFVSVSAQTPPPDAAWMADAIVDNPRRVTDAKLGACQGIAVRDGRILWTS